MKAKIEKTPYHSYKIRTLPKGCKLCVKGRKLVLFITGICNRNCFYCPISDEKKDKDVVYANEWDTGYSGDTTGKLTKKELDIIFEEARLCRAAGAGVTGGDPLLVIERTADAIKKLKKEFGKGFHIHLYTSPVNVTPERLRILHEAGLDEIRFHPSFTDSSDWGNIDLAREFRWDVGVEIPAIPEYAEETKKLIDFLDGRIDFLNLNELELSDSTANILGERGYQAKNDESYAVQGSEELALELMEYVAEKGLKFKVHYCTVKLKDKVQLGKRIKQRSKSTSTEMDIVTAEGLLIRGVIYPPETVPGVGYRRMLAGMDDGKRKEMIGKLKTIEKDLVAVTRMKAEELRIDAQKLRILTSRENVKANREKIKELGLTPAIVEEYPTHDALEVDIEFL